MSPNGPRLVGRTTSRLRVLGGLLVGALVLAVMANSAPVAHAAGPADPPTVLGKGAYNSFVKGAGALDNQAWWAVQDLHSKAKLFVSFNTTTSNLGIPVPHMLVIGVLPSGQGILGVTPAIFKTTQNPPSITSEFGSVTWDPTKKAYHLVVNMPAAFVFTPLPGPFKANLWLSGHPGGAAMPTVWDGQTSFLPQSIGAGTGNGTIKFPGVAQITATNWGTDAEPEYGTYLDGTSILSPPDHIGYEWADAQNPDGSATLLLAFAEESGVWRGLLSHTTAAGVVTECEPNVSLSHWSTSAKQLPFNVTGFHYPQQITASCAASTQAQPCLTTTWRTTAAGTQVGPFPAYSFDVSMSSGTTDVPGSVAWIQTFREKGSFGSGPTWSSTGLDRTPACVNPDS